MSETGTVNPVTQIGFVFQSFNLLSRTSALENVELPMLYAGTPRDERERRSKALLEEVGLETRMSHRPNELSGGQQQRVAIARSLANGIPLLMADEPTGNLDSASSLEILTLFRRLNRESGITIIVVTHSMEVAPWSDRIITFKDGLIVSDEPSTAAEAARSGDKPSSAAQAPRGAGIGLVVLVRTAWKALRVNIS